MMRSFLKSFCLVARISLLATPGFAVWPPSTSLEVASETSPTNGQAHGWPYARHPDAQTAIDKLELDKRRLDKVIQDLQDDEAALKKLSEKYQSIHGELH